MGYKTEKKIPSIILSVFIVLLILVGTIIPAYAAPTQDMMVTDNGEMLTEQDEQEISEMLYSINRQTGIEYLVYTIKSLNGEDIETCANRLFRTAGLGDKEKDNGLLFLLNYLRYAPSDVLSDFMGDELPNNMFQFELEQHLADKIDHMKPDEFDEKYSEWETKTDNFSTYHF